MLRALVAVLLVASTENAMAQRRDPPAAPNPPVLPIPKLMPAIRSHKPLIPRECGESPVRNPQFIDCWLDHNVNVRNNLLWKFPGNAPPVSYKFWPENRKAQFRQSFVEAWSWLEGDMSAPLAAPWDPLQNVLRPGMKDPDWVYTVLDSDTQAFPLWVAYATHQLAVEIGGWTPWSIRFYPNEWLQNLFAWNQTFKEDLDNGDIFDMPGTGNMTLTREATPPHPTVIHKFLADGNMIDSSHFETISAVVEWARSNLWHFAAEYTWAGVNDFWQYEGAPPISKIIAASTYTGTQYPFLSEQPRHWTAGCFGTSSFLIWALRAVNIPVEFRRSTETCGHAIPAFPTIDRTMSHGDDPYDILAGGSALGKPPIASLLISEATYTSWFKTGVFATSCANVSRQPVELAVNYLPTAVGYAYCADKASGASHAAGGVFQYYSGVYTVQQLEATQLWQRLETFVTQLNLCAGQ